MGSDYKLYMDFNCEEGQLYVEEGQLLFKGQLYTETSIQKSLFILNKGKKFYLIIHAKKYILSIY